MSEGSITYEATFSLEYDPGIFFIPGFGASIACPNVGSIFTLSEALEQAESLLGDAKTAVTSLSGGNLSFDAGAVADFAINTAVGEAQKNLLSGIPQDVSSATAFLSSFSPQQLASITTFNSIAESIGSPQNLISQVQSLSELASGSLGSSISSTIGSLLGGGGLSGVASSLVSSLGPAAASLAGGTLPTAETWGNVFGSSFNPDLTPFLNLSLGQLVPPIDQSLEVDIAGQTYGAPIKVPGVKVPVLGGISI
jgi:hypothetical protein